MGYVGVAWTIVAGMFVWAGYLHVHWSGVHALPMQWGLTGKPTWYAARAPAIFFIPVMAALLLAMITFARQGHSSPESVMLTASLLLSIQAFWVFLARRYV